MTKVSKARGFKRFLQIIKAGAVVFSMIVAAGLTLGAFAGAVKLAAGVVSGLGG